MEFRNYINGSDMEDRCSKQALEEINKGNWKVVKILSVNQINHFIK